MGRCLKSYAGFAKTSELHGSTHNKLYYAKDIFMLYGVDVQHESTSSYPTGICRSHQILMENFRAKREAGLAFQTDVNVESFEPHKSENCEICTIGQKQRIGGRRPSKKYKPSLDKTIWKYDPENHQRE